MSPILLYLGSALIHAVSVLSPTFGWRPSKKHRLNNVIVWPTCQGESRRKPGFRETRSRVDKLLPYR